MNNLQLLTADSIKFYARALELTTQRETRCVVKYSKI